MTRHDPCLIWIDLQSLFIEFRGGEKAAGAGAVAFRCRPGYCGTRLHLKICVTRRLGEAGIAIATAATRLIALCDYLLDRRIALCDILL
jgi:hypothetical protein